MSERDEALAPPAVPSLSEAEETAASAEPPVDLDRILGPVEGDDLPSELRALLDEVEPGPIVVVGDTEGDTDQVMADDVAEAEFYLSHGMLDEAQAVHRRMQARSPEHPAVNVLVEQIERAANAAAAGMGLPAPIAPSAPAPPPAEEELPVSEPILDMELDPALAQVPPIFTVTDVPLEEAPAGFVNLGAELNEELLADEAGTFPASGAPLVDELLADGRQAGDELFDEKDYETHYNLGIAYKEMELYDEAIQEFRRIAQEPKRALECADLVGLCFLAKGQPEQAIRDLEAGLAIEGHAPEAYHSLRYDLGTALEAVGDLPRALEQLERVESESGRFRDVATRVQALRARIQPAQAPATQGPAARKKKKISFI